MNLEIERLEYELSRMVTKINALKSRVDNRDKKLKKANDELLERNKAINRLTAENSKILRKLKRIKNTK